MKLDVTWTITAVIAFASIFSPVIVTIINSIHDTKIRKLKINSKIKQELLSKFSKNTMHFFTYNYFDENFYDSLSILYAYFDIDDTLVRNIINSKGQTVETFEYNVSEFMKSLSKQIQSK